ncbi:MAG: AMP-binding protein [Eubacteriales bacterium]|nr:AMP-binding protein [Eubacteriales bacterium]MDD4327122.1 AMP-binding protein [Eubacteriales bacterium]
MQTVKGKRYFESRNFRTVIEMLRQTRDLYPDLDAYIFRRTPDGDEIHKTYSRYLDDIEAFGTSLLKIGLKGSHIAVLGENRYEWAVAGTAIINGVGVSVPIDKLLPAFEVESLLDRGEVDAYIFSPKFMKDAADIATRNNRIKYFICMDISDAASDKPDDERFIDMQDLVSQGRTAIDEGDRSYVDADTDTEVMSMLLFTSGTTSMSKGVMLSQRNVCSNIASVAGCLKVNAGTRTLSVLPLHHTFENSVGMYMMQYYGATICFTDGLRYISRNLSEWKINNILAVPLLFENIYNKVNEALEASGKKNLVSAMVKVSRASLRIGIDLRRKLFKQILAGFGGNLELAVSGAAAIDPKIVQAFTDWGVKFFQGYGLTETSPVLSACNEFVNVIGSIGNPVSEVELAIDTEDPAPGATGEILAKGPNVMLGYYKNPEATAEVMTDDGWFRTGDVGYLDEFGCIHITGRIKSMIVLTNGKKCFPEEIEALMTNIPGLKETLVWGENSSRDSVDIVAALHIDREKISKEAGSDSDEDIAKWLSVKIREVNDMMPNFKNIKYFVLTEEDFVKTTTLKIKRNVNVDMIHDKLEKAGQTMRETHMKNIDHIA